MRINFDHQLKTSKGEPFRKNIPPVQFLIRELKNLADEQPDVRLKDAFQTIINNWNKLETECETLADVAYDALLSGPKASEGTATEKRVRAKLAAKIAHGGVIDLGETDLQLLKEELERHCNAGALLACDDAMVEYEKSESEAAE